MIVRFQVVDMSSRKACRVRILVAEDDAEIGDYIRKGLVAEGHAVDHLTDGREALTQATLKPYDLFLFDRMLPGLDGLSLLKSLRAAQVATPAILLTAMGAVDDRVAGLRAGAARPWPCSSTHRAEMSPELPPRPSVCRPPCPARRPRHGAARI